MLGKNVQIQQNYNQVSNWYFKIKLDWLSISLHSKVGNILICKRRKMKKVPYQTENNFCKAQIMGRGAQSVLSRGRDSGRTGPEAM